MITHLRAYESISCFINIKSTLYQNNETNTESFCDLLHLSPQQLQELRWPRTRIRTATERPATAAAAARPSESADRRRQSTLAAAAQRLQHRLVVVVFGFVGLDGRLSIVDVDVRIVGASLRRQRRGRRWCAALAHVQLRIGRCGSSAGAQQVAGTRWRRCGRWRSSAFASSSSSDWRQNGGPEHYARAFAEL